MLVHCSDGWDRTPQLVCIAQLLMDPYYRTLLGFIVLIEKDWVSMGHQFSLRNSIYRDSSDDEQSPIFLQFLDCVHQILIQYPNLFEFNLSFLKFLSYHINSCKYGTFLFDSEQGIESKKAKLLTISIWTDVFEKYKNDFINPFYAHSLNLEKLQIIYPNYALYKLHFWEDYFLKTNFTTKRYFTDSQNSKKQLLEHDTHYFELDKKESTETLKREKNNIQKLNNIIKDLTDNLTLSEEEFLSLNDVTKMFLKKYCTMAVKEFI